MKILEKIVGFFEDFKVPWPVVLLFSISVVFLVFSNLPSYTYLGTLGKGLGFVIQFTPIWLPIFLFLIFWKYWMIYVRADFLKSHDYKLLEIRLPKEIDKSPKAMETFLKNIFIKPGETTFINRNWEGKIRPWFSLEIVSLEGNIRFFIWTRGAFQRLVESHLYAQYPNIEIYEVNDYTDYVDPELKGFSLWGSNFVLTKKDPYPIKTYIDHGLEDETKEERKVDPLSSLLEYLGSIGKGEQIWIQILFQRYRPKKNFDIKKFVFEETDWRKEAKAEIDKLMMRDPKTKGPTTEAKTPEGFTLQPMLSEGEKQQIKAIDRSLEKPGFDSMIRGIYLAKEDDFEGTNIPGLIASILGFGSEHLNGFKPDGYMADYDYPWQDFTGKKQEKTRKNVLEAYRRRSFIHSPFKEKTFILTSEEIATIFHLPGWIVQPPTLERVPSKKTQPPSDLPI